MTGNNKKFPEVAIIVATTENGLIGNGKGLPWKSSLDMKHWFKKHTSNWPMVFGRTTAEGMIPFFPLENRFCSIISESIGTKIIKPEGSKGEFLSFGSKDDTDALTRAISLYNPFDKIFIGGGAILYKQAMTMTKPGSELPMVDTIIKTVFPDGIVTGDKYLDKDIMKQMSAPNFELVAYQEYKLDASNEGYTNHTLYHEGNDKTIHMPTTHKLGKNDTKFPWIRFEIWKRVVNNEHVK